MTVYLFDSHGTWIAYLKSESSAHVFDPRGGWIGWCPFSDGDVWDQATRTYLGTIIGDRLLRRRDNPLRKTPSNRKIPSVRATPLTPRPHSSTPLPDGYRDLL